MDTDDLLPAKKKPDIVLGEDLALLSVAELEQRIERLVAEIERVRETLATKRSSKDAANAFFRS